MNTVFAVSFSVLLLITAGLLWSFVAQRRLPWQRKGMVRLSLVDSLPLDTKRRLVLVTRDHTQHLLLIGGPNDVVIETGIQSHTATARSHDEDDLLPGLDFPSLDARRAMRR